MKAAKFRFYPTLAQRRQLAKDLGCAKYAYNWGLSQRKDYYKEHKKSISYAEVSRNFTQLKKEKLFLKESCATVTVNALFDLDEAFKRFYKKLGRYPRRKKINNSCCYQIDKRRGSKIFKSGKLLKLPKIGAIKVVWTKDVEVIPNSATVSRDSAGRWFVSLQLDCECSIKAPKTNQEIGVDLGIKSFAVTSDGKIIKSPMPLKRGLVKLKKKSRHLSKKKKGSKNRKKARKQLGRTHARIADKRRDFLHKTSTAIVRQHKLVAIEDLDVKAMSKKDKRKGKLSRSIGDASWYEFRRQLEYKSKWYGRELIVIPRFDPTSKRCSCCGYELAELDLNVRSWLCPSCDEYHDRDINAARNILDTARSAGSACGESVRLLA